MHTYNRFTSNTYLGLALACLWFSLSACGGQTCATGCDSEESNGHERIQIARSLPHAKLRMALWPKAASRSFSPHSLDSQIAASRFVEEAVRIEHPFWWNGYDAAGYSLVNVQDLDEIFFGLLDSAHDGKGSYLFRQRRPRVSRPVIIQAPHAFFDRKSGDVALHLFRTSKDVSWALFTNSTHRFEVDDDGEHPADVAHAETSAFSQATEAMANACQRCVFIQIHGFAASESLDADVIVSAGRRKATTLSRRVAAHLQENHPGFRVRLYPDDVKKLGATTNVQGRLLRRFSRTRFLHLEMSPAFRKAILDGKANLSSTIEILSREK